MAELPVPPSHLETITFRNNTPLRILRKYEYKTGKTEHSRLLTPVNVVQTKDKKVCIKYESIVMNSCTKSRSFSLNQKMMKKSEKFRCEELRWIRPTLVLQNRETEEVWRLVGAVTRHFGLLDLIDEEYEATREEGDIKCLTSLIDGTKPRDVYLVGCRSEGNKALARLLKVDTLVTLS